MKLPFRNGFATITALVLMSLVGVALAGLMLAFTAATHRSAKESSDAQLRQLLLAGSIHANQLVKSSNLPHGPISVALPTSLKDAAISIEMNSPEHVHITARLGKFHAEQ